MSDVECLHYDNGPDCHKEEGVNCYNTTYSWTDKYVGIKVEEGNSVTAKSTITHNMCYMYGELISGKEL